MSSVLTDTICFKILCHLVGEVDGGAVCAYIYGVAHEVFVEQAVAANDEAFAVESVHQFGSCQVGAGADLHEAEFLGLCDDRVVLGGDIAHRHEPALWQL